MRGGTKFLEAAAGDLFATESGPCLLWSILREYPHAYRRVVDVSTIVSLIPWRNVEGHVWSDPYHIA